MAAGRGLGGKRCIRKSVSLTNDQDKKSKLLAISCDMSQAELLSLMIKISLDSPNLINVLQDRYNKNEKFKVFPGHVNGNVEFF
ncbi:hypothetical protein [Alteribacillus sp. HJP-4]|uniref:hypothetical protein n=1 Tax=Alteribacillus sp. HJP-4 TaxID=2775394 RepID=UPI0035CD3A7A